MSIKPKWIYVAVGLLSVLIYMVGFSGIGGSAAEAFFLSAMAVLVCVVVLKNVLGRGRDR
jgi:hypothetical protein